MTFKFRKTLWTNKGQSHSEIHNTTEHLMSCFLVHCHHFLKTVLQYVQNFLSYFGNSQRTDDHMASCLASGHNVLFSS